MTFIQSFVADVDIFPLVGRAFHDEPALIENLVSDNLTVTGITTCVGNLSPQGHLTDYIRSEFTEKGFGKYTSLLWGTLVIKPQDSETLNSWKAEYKRRFTIGDHYRVGPSNMKVNADTGVITFWRWAKESDNLGPSEAWFERFLESQFLYGQPGQF